MTLRWPLPAPNRYSPQAAALASFSTTTGRPVRSWTSSFSGSLRQSMFGAKYTVERCRLTYPAAPMPTPTISCPARAPSTAEAMASTMASGVVGVGTLKVERMLPSSSTT